MGWKILFGLLTVLKWIGIVLLGLIALVLLVLLVVLLCSIRYQVQAQQSPEPNGQAEVRWLFGALYVLARYQEGKLELTVRLCGKTILGEGKKEKKKKKRNKTAAKKVQNAPIAARERTDAPTPPAQRKEKADTLPLEAQEKPSLQEKAEEKEDSLLQQEPPLEKEKERVAAAEENRPSAGIRRVKVSHIAPDNAPDTQEPAREASCEEKQAEEEGLSIRYFLQMEEKKELAAAFGRLLRRLMKGVLPKDFSLSGTFGTGDPAATGYLLAAAGIAKAKFGENLQIRGDFSKATAEDISVRVKGRIRLGYLAWAGMAFVCAKPVRRIIKTIWKGRR